MGVSMNSTIWAAYEHVDGRVQSLHAVWTRKLSLQGPHASRQTLRFRMHCNLSIIPNGCLYEAAIFFWLSFSFFIANYMRCKAVCLSTYP